LVATDIVRTAKALPNMVATDINLSLKEKIATYIVLRAKEGLPCTSSERVKIRFMFSPLNVFFKMSPKGPERVTIKMSPKGPEDDFLSKCHKRPLNELLLKCHQRALKTISFENVTKGL